MAVSAATANDLIRYMFIGVTPTWVAETHFYVALHTAEPVVSQTESEVSYAGYARAAVIRTAAGFTIAGGQARNTAAVNTGVCTAGTAMITHVSIGVAASGESQILVTQVLPTPLSVGPGAQAKFNIDALTIEVTAGV